MGIVVFFSPFIVEIKGHFICVGEFMTIMYLHILYFDGEVSSVTDL